MANEFEKRDIFASNTQENIVDDGRDHLGRTFQQRYLNPDAESDRYNGRDLLVGQIEAAKRLAVMPQVNNVIAKLSAECGTSIPWVRAVGSAAVYRCTQDSDLDLALIVKVPSPFLTDQSVREKLRFELTQIQDADFAINPLVFPQELIDPWCDTGYGREFLTSLPEALGTGEINFFSPAHTEFLATSIPEERLTR